jgi:transglycosylase-like protein
LRLLLRLSLLGLGTTIVLAGAAGAARKTTVPTKAAGLRTIRTEIDHYRQLAWSFAHVAHEKHRPTSFSYRRSTDTAYLEWTLGHWELAAYEERGHALAAIRARTKARMPHAPRLHAVLGARISFARTLTMKLKRLYPGRVTTSFARARANSGSATLRLWQARSAQAALAVAAHPQAAREEIEPSADPLAGRFLCIHRFEGSWSANTGNGYYGGLQMDYTFMRRYGSAELARWGTADSWPAAAQIAVAERAYRSGRGFWPWPNSARLCGLL